MGFSGLARLLRQVRPSADLHSAAVTWRSSVLFGNRSMPSQERCLTFIAADVNHLEILVGHLRFPVIIRMVQSVLDKFSLPSVHAAVVDVISSVFGCPAP